MWPQVPRTSGCVELLSCLFCSQHRYCIFNWTTRKRRKAGWRSHWRPLYVVLALPSSSSSLQQQALRSQLWLGLMHQYPHWHVSSYIKTHPTLLHCGFTSHCHLCLLDEELLMDRGTKDSCDVSAQRGCCDAKAQRDFTLVAWAVFTQQVCNRLKRSLLKELGPEPRPLLEAIIGRECVGWTHTEQDEWGGEEGWHNLSFQYANDQFKRWKLWQTHQPYGYFGLDMWRASRRHIKQAHLSRGIFHLGRLSRTFSSRCVWQESPENSSMSREAIPPLTTGGITSPRVCQASL